MTPKQYAALASLEARTGLQFTTARHNSAGAISARWTDELGAWRVLICARGFIFSVQQHMKSNAAAGYYKVLTAEDSLPAGLQTLR